MESVILETPREGILKVILNRPERLNALDSVLTGELTKVFSDLNRDREVRVVVLTGMGKGFCAGADLKAQGSGPGSIPGTQGMSQLVLCTSIRSILPSLCWRYTNATNR